MADQELLDDFLEALETAGSPAKNPELREALGWDMAQYEAVKAELVSRGIVKRGPPLSAKLSAWFDPSTRGPNRRPCNRPMTPLCGKPSACG